MLSLEEYEVKFLDYIEKISGLERSKIRRTRWDFGQQLVKKNNDVLIGLTNNDDFIVFYLQFDEDQNLKPELIDDLTIVNQRIITLNLMISGPKCDLNAKRMSDLVYTTYAQNMIQKEGITLLYSNSSKVQTDEFINGRWFKRRNIDIKFVESVELSIEEESTEKKVKEAPVEYKEV